MRLKTSTVMLVLLVATVGSPILGVASGNEAPLADAGLDQEVIRGSTVHLDATESRDPDGTIEQYEWSISTPENETITPDCRDCARTQFTPQLLGVYEVTVTVTDDDGASSSDTLYVTVSPGSGPDVQLSGPTDPTVGSPASYTADAQSGAAPLEEVRWFVDGERVKTDTVSGETLTVDLARTFPNEAKHTISVTVYDEDGQRASDSLSVQVEDSDTGGGNDPGESPTIAEDSSATIDGPQTILGERPLQGNYIATTSANPDQISGIEWHTTSGVIGSGNARSITWEPGDHELFAIVTYVDGSSDVAKFPDGSTTVVADPEPSLSLDDVSDVSEIASKATATDEYENLKSVSVSIDGETVAENALDPVELQKHGGAEELLTSFRYRDIEPERPYELTVEATDLRGQTTTLVRSVTPTGEPEIVRSEFVNDPVDSYHERIDPDRYAAHHVLEIDLNGVDPEDVDVVHQPVISGKTRAINSSDYVIRRNVTNGKLVISSYWAGLEPGNYMLESGLSFSGNEFTKWNRSKFEVTPSKPELRFEVVSPGRVDQVSDWGLVVDASESFDPDGTDISYIWKYGANPIVPDNSTAKFDSFQRAALTIEDGHGLTTTYEGGFLGYYNPGIAETAEVSEGPYKPNDTVQFRVFTEPYKLSKNRYDVDLGIDAPDASAQVVEWEEVQIDNGDCRKGSCDYQIPLPDRLDIDNRRYRFYTGIVEVEASAFENGTSSPEITLYNRDHPDRTSETGTLADVNVLLEGERYWQNVSVTDIEYTIEKPQYDRVVTSDESKRDEYLRDNYSIASTDSTKEYVVERRVKTQDAEYETEQLSFDKPGMKRTFLAENPEWKEAGTKTKTETYTTTETEWRDSRTGKGTFTGEKKEVLVTPARYQTERQYRYEYEVERTGTRTVTRTGVRKVRKTDTRTVTKCDINLGCYETTETYSYWTEEPYTYQTTEEYTYYETKEDTYWATGRHHPDHEFTGRSKTVKTKDAVYETRYKFEHEVERTRTVTRYLVEQQVEVQPAKYEWQEYDVLSDKVAAQAMAKRGSDWRMGEIRSTSIWTLKKQTGTRKVVQKSYENASNVIETKAKISGKIAQIYINIETSEEVYEVIKTESDTFFEAGAWTRNDIEEHLEIGDNDAKNNENMNWCELKSYC